MTKKQPKGKYARIIFGIVFFIVIFAYKPVQAKTISVNTERELQQCLLSSKSLTIVLEKDIPITKQLLIYGEKKVEGKGHCLFRGKKKVYGGTLFSARGIRCEWRNVTISGESDAKSVKGKVFGRLLDVRTGEVILDVGCQLVCNRNTSLAVDGGGALVVHKTASCYMKAGKILDNANVSCGAAVLVEKGGKFVMSGGLIEGNRVSGIGTVVGFEGRGGAICNAGTFQIQGGKICNNQVEAYRRNGMAYGGVGGAIYNEGNCLIAGGAIIDNRSSIGGALLYSTSASTVTITGGILKQNKERGENPLYLAGKLTLAGNPKLKELSLMGKITVNVKEDYFGESDIVLTLSSYKEGRRITKGKKIPISLKTKKYILRYRKNGYFIEKKKIEKKNSKRKVKSSKKKGEEEQIFFPYKELVFFEGEYVDTSILLYGITKKEKSESRLEVIYPKKKLDTGKVGSGKIRYCLVSKGKKSMEKQIPYRIVENKKPKLKSAKRYFFLSEVKNFSMKEWYRELWEECVASDDIESPEELFDSMEVESCFFEKKCEGEYEFYLRITDQFGHRYYMKKGEKKRYGKGKTIQIRVFVSIVNAEKEAESIQYVQFVEPEKNAECLVQWHFTEEEIRKFHNYIKKERELFSLKMSQEFLEWCQKRRKKGRT